MQSNLLSLPDETSFLQAWREVGPTIAGLAARLSWRTGADVSDLLQEGRLAVWLAMRRDEPHGNCPSGHVQNARWRMFNYAFRAHPIIRAYRLEGLYHFPLRVDPALGRGSDRDWDDDEWGAGPEVQTSDPPICGVDLDAAVALLKPAAQRAIRLRFYEGAGLEAIGLALGCSAKAAHQRIRYALQLLRRHCLRKTVPRR